MPYALINWAKDLQFMYPNTIVVWAFQDAPKIVQDLSKNGGDEDWVAILPVNYKGEPPSWMEEHSRFGCCSVDLYPLPDGRTVVIGSHA